MGGDLTARVDELGPEGFLPRALAYAAADWPVFPLAPRSKVPLLAGGHGHLDGTTDLAETRARWRAEPFANIGARVPDNLVVVDVDPRHGGFDSLRALERDAKRRHYTECAPPPPDYERAAWGLLKVCSAELGTDLPLLRWFQAETPAEAAYAERYGYRDWLAHSTDGPVRGLYYRDSKTVWVDSALPLTTILATVAHEVAHVAGGDEAEAQRYEKRWAENLPTAN